MSCAGCGGWVGRPSWQQSSAVFQLCDMHVYHAQCIIVTQQKKLKCKECRKYNAYRDPNYMGNNAIILQHEKATDLYLQDVEYEPRAPRLNYPLNQAQAAQMQRIANDLHFAETRPTNKIFNTILIALLIMHIIQLAVSIYEKWECKGLCVLLSIFQGLSILPTLPVLDVMDMRYIIAAPACMTITLIIIAAHAFRWSIMFYYASTLMITLASVRFNKWRAYELHTRQLIV